MRSKVTATRGTGKAAEAAMAREDREITNKYATDIAALGRAVDSCVGGIEGNFTTRDMRLSRHVRRECEALRNMAAKIVKASAKLTAAVSVAA